MQPLTNSLNMMRALAYVIGFIAHADTTIIFLSVPSVCFPESHSSLQMRYNKPDAVLRFPENLW